ncbi:DEAD/DEAH box helicase [Candidatus Woesearchaeota archaeon]|nr:DEAD/DEAH box helicase [Candidatus Woesearchaeota archaeon]
MNLSEIQSKVPKEFYAVLEKYSITELRPAQAKAMKAGLLEGNNLLVCTPTASGKTLVAEIAALHSILNRKGKAIYIVPLKALASEKYREFKEKYGHLMKIALSMGDIDSADPFLKEYDLIIATSEKMDSLIRHHAPWLRDIYVVIVDEIHLLNDADRGPTLEVLLTLLRRLLKNIQIIGLSATIGNPKELAAWLDAKLVQDDWRPVKLHQGVYLGDEVEFVD